MLTSLTLSALAIASIATASPAGGDLTIVNARIYRSPEAAPIEHGALVIRGGRIIAVTASPPRTAHSAAVVIDAHGSVVTAGFWNCHVHIFTPALLHADKAAASQLSAELEAMFTRWGFTTVFDLASSLENTEVIRQRIAIGEVTGPRIFTVGDPFFPEHGTPIYVRKFLEDNGFPSFEVSTAAQARARARRELSAGADGLKIFAGAIVGGDVAADAARYRHRGGAGSTPRRQARVRPPLQFARGGNLD